VSELDAAAGAGGHSILDQIPARLRERWLRLLYRPSPWAILLNPYYIVRRGLYRGIERGARFASGRVLDFGAGSAPYRDLFHCDEYLTVDIAAGGHPATRKVAAVLYDGHALPFPAEHFDFILCSEVLEHVFNLEEVLGELQRVLKPGGYLLVTVPFVWEEHERPYDFARYTSFARSRTTRRRPAISRHCSR
jgi:SAM-dependent methyltransferase